MHVGERPARLTPPTLTSTIWAAICAGSSLPACDGGEGDQVDAVVGVGGERPGRLVGLACRGPAATRPTIRSRTSGGQRLDELRRTAAGGWRR